MEHKKHRGEQQSADELIRQLRASLFEDTDDEGDEDDVPEDVFSEDTVTVRRSYSDAEDGFDSKMAHLLGDLMSESAQMDEPEVELTPDQETDLIESEADDDEADEDDVSARPDGEGESADWDAEHDGSEPTEQELPDGVPSESEEDGVAAATDDTVELITAQPMPEVQKDVLSCMTEEGEAVSEAWDGEELPPEIAQSMERVTAAYTTGNESRLTVELPEMAWDEPVDEPPAQSDEQPEQSPITPGVEDEELEVLPDEDIPDAPEHESEQEIEQPVEPLPQWQELPTELHEGEVLLDEYEDAPPSAQPPHAAFEEAAMQPPVQQPPVEKTSLPMDEGADPTPSELTPAVAVRVASPLDAARKAAAQRAAKQAMKPKPSPLDAIMGAGNLRGNIMSVGEGAPAMLSGERGVNSSRRERVLSDEDIDLLLDLGYENHLAQKIGNERVEEAKLRRRDNAKNEKLLRTIHGCSGTEYAGHVQDHDVRVAYRKNKKAMLWRLVLTVLLGLLTLAVDLYPTVVSNVVSIPRLPTGRGYALLSLVVLLLTVLPSYRVLKRGLRAFWRFEWMPEMATALVTLATLVYDVLLLLSPQDGIRLNFPVAVALLLLTVGELLQLQHEQLSFEVVSARSRKIVVERMEPKKKKVVRDGHIVKIINDDGNKKLLRVRPTNTLAGYFRRSGESTPRYRSIAYLLLGAGLLSMLAGGVSLIVNPDVWQAATVCLVTLQAAAPLCALWGYAYPMLLSTKQLTGQGCAIIGQSAIDEYAGEKTLLFDDAEMFRSKSSTEITIKGSGDPKRYIRYAKRLFHTLGGTLSHVTTSDMSQETYAERVEILKISDEGVEARIDGKVHVLAGSSSFLIQKGIRVPSENAELMVRRQVESCILYLAFDGKLRLGYEIDYRISGRFEEIATQLSAKGTTVAIYSCDPCINTHFLQRSRLRRATPIRVMKPVRFQRQTEAYFSDSGVVATRSARDIAKTMLACEALLHNDRQITRVHGITMLFSAVLMMGLTLFGVVNQGLSLIAALLQVGFCVPIGLISRKNIWNEEQSEHDNRDRK